MQSDKQSNKQSDITVISRHTVPIRDESDVYAAVGLARKMTTDMGFAPGARACAQTIIAELARNALRHGGGGTVELCALESPSLGGPPSLGGTPSLGGQETRHGLEIVVQDRGPGIPDVSRALEGTPAPVIASRSLESSEGAPNRHAAQSPSSGGPPSSGGSPAARPAVSSGAGLGVGLSSAQRLADEFTIDSVVGSGTRVRALKWNSPGPADDRSVGAAARPRPSVGTRPPRPAHKSGARAGPRPLSRRNK